METKTENCIEIDKLTGKLIVIEIEDISEERDKLNEEYGGEVDICYSCSNFSGECKLNLRYSYSPRGFTPKNYCVNCLTNVDSHVIRSIKLLDTYIEDTYCSDACVNWNVEDKKCSIGRDLCHLNFIKELIKNSVRS